MVLDKNGLRVDDTTPSVRFSVRNQAAINEGIAHLNKYGYTVFSDVMEMERIEENKELLWQFLESIPAPYNRIRRNQPSTWNYWPGIRSHGVINTYGMGQSAFMWNIRSNRQIKRIYEQLWNRSDLLVSFEGCGIFRDWSFNETWKTEDGWNHVDQNPNSKPDRCCVQGFVSLTDQNESTGGLVVYPESHSRFSELRGLGKGSRDFVFVPATHPIFDGGRAIGKLVHCNAGDLVVWDSRTIHCNSPATVPKQNHGKVDLLRIVAYVSMSPINLVSKQYTLDEFRFEREQMVQNNRTLTHWSTEIILGAMANPLNKQQLSLDNFTTYQRTLIFGTIPEDKDDEK
ncbi:unnamed protein product [Adineta ricciae]|uniref:Phytanoyl-CoA dioxygenase n=1 Tax=Adineta ricciae TaxID=249248 RepID=A0A815R1B2_ADIRI|nr:unnamed protein product [Adineta ricciae]CAF1661597.1 unnamed protein product [Adineta ricciae]